MATAPAIQTNVPAIDWTPAGPVLPTETQILTGVQQDLNTAFGGNLNPALETPQGQLASSLTAIIADANANLALVANQVDPDYAEGLWQDAIGKIYFLTRIPAAGTVVQCQCLGLAGTVIPIGAMAQDTSNNQYACTQGGTIPPGGSITLEFTNVAPGPIGCPAGTLTTIYSAIPGWDTITNPQPGVLGNLVETRQAFEVRRKASVALNSQGSPSAVNAAVLAVPGVLNAYTIDNPQNTPQTIGGVTLAPNSIYCAVVGGEASAVAQAIWSKKSAGCNYNGNTQVTVTDPTIGSNPLPQYQVSFEIPAELPFFFNVQIMASSLLPTNIVALIQQAIINAFAGLDGGPAAAIGSTQYASRYYATVAAVASACEVVSIQIAPQASITGSISGTTLTVTEATGAPLQVGSVLSGSGLAANTTITALGSGTGGLGTYTVSNSQTVASEAMTALLFVNYAPVNINQMPTVSAANISVAQV